MLVISEKISDAKSRVLASYIDGAVAEVIQTVVIPEPIPQPEKRSVLYIDTITNDFFYEYEDRELTSAEQLSRLKYDNAQMVLALVIGGLM